MSKATLLSGLTMQRSGLSGCLDDLGLSFGVWQANPLQAVPTDSSPVLTESFPTTLLTAKSALLLPVVPAAVTRIPSCKSESSSAPTSSEDSPRLTDGERPDESRESSITRVVEPTGKAINAPEDSMSPGHSLSFDHKAGASMLPAPHAGSPDSLTAAVWGCAVAGARAEHRGSLSSSKDLVAVAVRGTSKTDDQLGSPTIPDASKANNFVRVVGGFS